MSAKTLSNMWIVIAFMAMAATAAQAAGSNFYAPQQWGGDGVTDQAVDEQYFRRMVEREPGAVIVAAVAANNRERIGGLEGRVGDLEGRVDGHDTELLRQARCNYGGPSYSSPAATQGPSGAGSTTINNNYYGDSPATPSVTPPKPPPSGGDNNKKSKPAKEPEEGRAPVVTFWQVIGGLIVLGALGYGLYAAFTSTATANEDNAEKRRIKRQEQQTAANAGAFAEQGVALQMLATASPDGVNERYKALIRDSAGRAFGWREGNLHYTGGTTAGAGGVTPRAITPDPAETAARAGLSRAGSLSAVPAVAAGQAQAIAAILTARGIDLTDDAAVDAVVAANPV